MRAIEKGFKGLKIAILCTVIAISTLLSVVPVSAAEANPLSLWTEGATSKAALVNYMNDITNEASPNYIPVQDRVAVFDLDGTLFCETDPVYFDHMLLQHRVLEDPTYKNKATDFEKEVANKVIEFAETGTYPKGMDNDHGKAVASAFSGMTVDEFTSYVIKYRETPANGYNGMTKGDAFYKPMVEVIQYLQANGFTTYIVSGTDRLIVRGLVAGKLPILPRNIIGSDETIVSNNQADADGLEYVFTEKDKLVLGGNFVIKNLKMNKVAVIAQEIGQQPVLSFGNSTGDASMAEYVTSNNKYKSLAFMLCCDDTVRENGKLSSAEKMYKLCEEFDWIPISMKNDWTTIYGDGVTRK
ncbi:haloacid dehalogenase-like hydrolase [Pseudobutyrivibrio sp. 49]|uniref:haloacid dehalogenase-like hydrolase n=1 Tax=Pseudobutyrivibrio sp. 49 TaxID=1855344 RepID=UPI00088C334E|nr:HAD family hydrolase [Pseudobutyrivibrio sp. 49]SDI31062.1 haloacid dehalogenase-like hydrolase [Pseudobutyrivibrio sp. 49]